MVVPKIRTVEMLVPDGAVWVKVIFFEEDRLSVLYGSPYYKVSEYLMSFVLRNVIH